LHHENILVRRHVFEFYNVFVDSDRAYYTTFSETLVAPQGRVSTSPYALRRRLHVLRFNCCVMMGVVGEPDHAEDDPSKPDLTFSAGISGIFHPTVNAP